MILFFRCTHWIVREIQVYNRSIKQTYYKHISMTTIGFAVQTMLFFMVIVVNTYRYHYYSGMNIHKIPAMDLMWTEGVPGFLTHPHLQFGGQRLCSLGGGVVPLPWWPFCVANCNEKNGSGRKNIRIDGWCYYPNQHILFISGEFWFVMKIKFMLLPQSTYCSEGGDNFWPLMKVKLMFLPHATYCSEGGGKF